MPLALLKDMIQACFCVHSDVFNFVRERQGVYESFDARPAETVVARTGNASAPHAAVSLSLGGGHETMHQHLYTFLNHKYGLKSLVNGVLCTLRDRSE